MRSRNLAIGITTICSLWSLSFVLLGATTQGKGWYGNVTSHFFQDAKGGLPIITLVIPVLVSGCFSMIFHVRPGYRITGVARSILPHHCPIWIHRLVQRWNDGSGDVNFKNFAFTFIFVPLSIYVLASIRRKLQDDDMSLDDQLMEAGNSFGMMALVAFSYFLIPVARHSPIVKLLNWNQVAAIQLHMWSGRIIIVGSFVHGSMHMYRWFLAGESVISMLVPPAGCWTLVESEFKPQCNDSDSDCSCYDHFRNLTGFLALVSLLVIGGTSIGYIRRKHYHIFYMTHVLAAPTVLIMSILHWNRSILYMAPSMLYYAASSAPVMLEAATKRKRGQGVQIVSVEKVASMTEDETRQSLYVSLTFSASDDAMRHFRPGYYIKLLVPDIAANYHPFTVNKVAGKPNQLRIIFRATGSFTYELAMRLIDSVNASIRLPRIHIDGFHGPSQRVEQLLKHDLAVLVAGGIGITPYLSLLHDVESILSSSHSTEHVMGTKLVILHWICRDANLANYVRLHYFEPLIQKHSTSKVRIRIIVHNTSHSPRRTSYSDSPEMTPEDESVEVAEATTGTARFTPTRFSSGAADLKGNLLGFFAFSVISWLGLVSIWYLYSNVQSSSKVASRGWSALVMIVISFVTAALANGVAGRCQTGVHDERNAKESRRHDGSWWTSVNNDLVEDIESRIEMEPIDEGVIAAKGDDDGGLVDECTLNAIRYEEKRGRPTVHEMLKGLEGARFPAVFACGPVQLIQDLRSAMEERCAMRVRHCIRGIPQIAMYEETFET